MGVVAFLDILPMVGGKFFFSSFLLFGWEGRRGGGGWLG
jgi:hypothetical protein